MPFPAGGFHAPDKNTRTVRNVSRGFTLVEVLVTVVLVSVAIVGVLGGIRTIQDTNAKARTAELLQRLATEKISGLETTSGSQHGRHGG